jgi:DNA-directed RNA polymerase subunit RPC12/RpoP/Ca2+-binding EF-hand superfamily protein
MTDHCFKSRSSKRLTYETKTTLDNLHKNTLLKLYDISGELNELHVQYNKITQLYNSETDLVEKYRLEQLIKKLKQKIDSTDQKQVTFDYFLDTGEILFKYYEIQDRINNGADNIVNVSERATPGSIFEALNSASKQDSTAELINSTKETLHRDALLEQYLLKMDPNYSRQSLHSMHDSSFTCDACGEDMKISINDATVSCPECGFHKLILMDSDKPSYKDPPREISYYAYKRINHFNEWLAQFQAKESTEIPEEVFENIQAQIQKERLPTGSLSRNKIREILKKLKYNSYYEHVPHIMSRLNGNTAPIMDRDMEEKLRYLFKEIQPSFQKHCPTDRSNFLSYSYVLYKLCQLLELDDFLHCFPLLKNRDKLYAQDKIWEKICKDLQWEFIRSI